MVFTMPNGAEVKVLLSPSIEVSGKTADKARAAQGITPVARIIISGRERTIGTTGLIELSQLGHVGTAYHEVFHAVYDMCLTEKEKAALHRAFDKEARKQGRDVYEVMADQYRDWMLARQQGRGTRFGKLWQKVKDMAAGLLRVLRGADHASDVFHRVESGKVWERPAQTAYTSVKYKAGGIENQQDAGYNEDRISKAVFDKYLNDGIMQMVRDAVAREIEEHVNLADMSDPVKRDAARDQLPYIKKMLVWFNTSTIQNNQAYKDRLATKIEYARRCFDNDERIRSQYGEVRPSDGDNRQRRINQTGNGVVSQNDQRGSGEDNRQGVSGVSRSVTASRSRAWKHFNYLYEQMKMGSRSEIQDGFSDAEDSTHYSAEAEEAPRSFADKAFLEHVTQLLFVARFLERIGDHAVNIAEWVIYLETAERIHSKKHID